MLLHDFLDLTDIDQIENACKTINVILFNRTAASTLITIGCEQYPLDVYNTLVTLIDSIVSKKTADTFIISSSILIRVKNKIDILLHELNIIQLKRKSGYLNFCRGLLPISPPLLKS